VRKRRPWWRRKWTRRHARSPLRPKTRSIARGGGGRLISNHCTGHTFDCCAGPSRPPRPPHALPLSTDRALKWAWCCTSSCRVVPDGSYAREKKPQYLQIKAKSELTLAETSAVIASAPSSHATAEIMKKNHEIMEKDHVPRCLCRLTLHMDRLPSSHKPLLRVNSRVPGPGGGAGGGVSGRRGDDAAPDPGAARCRACRPLPRREEARGFHAIGGESAGGMGVHRASSGGDCLAI
jgi:hypothetical protein